jgi:hypothetical protein
MKTSENLDKLATALKEFQFDMPKLSRSKEVKVKTKSGGSYSFKYTPLEEILEEVLPRLAEYGLSITQIPASNASVTNVLMHESGQYISETASFDISTNNPQDLGGVLTYLRRYSLAGMLGIVTDEDDDANSAAGNEIVNQKRKKQNTRKKRGSTKSKKKEEKEVPFDEDDEVKEKITSFDNMDDLVEYFNDQIAQREGKAKKEFREKYQELTQKQIEKFKDE